MHMRRFVFEDWVPRKLAVRVGVPELIDLERAKASPKLAQNQQLQDSQPTQPTGPQINEDIVNQLMDMGMPRVRCERAAVATNNSSADAAMNWLFEHMEDPDIDTPLVTKKEAASPSVAIPEDLVMQLCDMGFTPPQAKKALKETQCNMDRAVEWLFSHADEPVTEETVQEEVPMEIEQGSAKYKLFAFIVHLGSSAHSGHYVAYVHKEGRWVQYNDRKVAESKEPPIGDAYMYFFERL
jgi:ubiquitin carboxyl-terminal hydrolase 5/13